MAGAEVVTVVSNQVNSFKVANVGEVEGAFTLDLAAGIRGQVGRRAEMIPVSVSLHGEGDERWGDLCEGPHLDGFDHEVHFKLLNVAGA